MDIKHEHEEAIHTLVAMYEGPRAKAVLDFARKRGFDKATVTCPDGSQHAASMYAWQLYCNAATLANNAPDAVELFQVVSIMSALEESMEIHFKNYGTKLLYDMRKAGVGPTSMEFSAFMAMDSDWNNKVELFKTNPYGVYFYTGRLKTLYSSLPGMICPFGLKGTPIVLPERLETTVATIDRLGMTYVPQCIGEDNALKFAGVLNLLRRKSDFYTAVNAGNFEEGSLAAHSLDVIYKLVEITNPTTPAEVGECILTGLIHDLAEVHVVQKRDAEGNMEFLSLPYGHEQKVLYIVGGYLDNCLPETVAAAIDIQMEPCVQMLQYPMGLCLHIADVLATFTTTEKK